MRQDMNMDEIMEYQGRLYFMPRKEIKEKTEELLDFCGLLPFRKRTVRKLSGGMKRKLMVCRALLTSPEILLLDEPTRGIDVGAKHEIYEIMNDLAAQGKAIIMISSEMPELLGMCDRIYVMSEGRLAGEFTAEEATQERIMASIMQEQNKK